MTVQFGGLLALAVAAFAAPLAAQAIPRRLVPPVVLEVLVGIAIGPQGLGLVHATDGVYTLYLLGFGFLLFLAGQEVEVGRFRGPTFRLTAASFIVGLVISVPVALVLRVISPGADIRLLALAMTASSLGVMVPVLRDANEISTDFGQLAIMAGSVGEFAALLLLTILFSAAPEPTWAQVAYVAALGAPQRSALSRCGERGGRPGCAGTCWRPIRRPRNYGSGVPSSSCWPSPPSRTNSGLMPCSVRSSAAWC